MTEQQNVEDVQLPPDEEEEGRRYLTTGPGAPPTEAEAEFLRNAKDLPEAQLSSDEALQKELQDETFIPAEGIPDIPLERCNLHFILNLTEVDSLADALDQAAVTLGRYGMDAFYVLAADPDTDRQWIVQGGVATTAEEELATMNEGEDDQPGT